MRNLKQILSSEAVENYVFILITYTEPMKILCLHKFPYVSVGYHAKSETSVF